jgi:kynureninase
MVAALLIGAACQPSPGPEARPDELNPSAQPGEAASPPQVIRKQQRDPAAELVLLDAASLGGDPRTGHRVELSVQAEQWPDGRVLWEHAHRWVLVVRAGDGVFVLLDELVPHGHASFRVVESDYGPVVVAETESGTAGIWSAAFAWSAADDGFRQVSGIRVDGLLRHRTPPEVYTR